MDTAATTSNADVSAARRPVVWTIAGTDSGGGAGIQADTRMLDAFGVHAACAVAAITAQNSRTVERVEPVPPDVLDAQLAALSRDMPPAAIKTGLLGSVENLRVVARWVRRLRERPDSGGVALVVDPVFGATTGASFATDALRAAYRDELLPLATLACPNTAEAAALAPAGTARDPAALAAAWRRFGARAVIVTGGNVGPGQLAQSAWAQDFLDTEQARGWLALPRLGSAHDHGTGCVFASAAAAAFAHGFVAADAAVLAKMATTEALRHGYGAGGGAGPVSPRGAFATRAGNLPRLASSPNPPAQAAFRPLRSELPGLYAIVDDAAWVERVLRAGVRLVQLRIKSGATDLLAREIRAAVALARHAGALLFVNDHWELALELGASGVHLGQEDLAAIGEPALASLRAAGLHLGISTHSYWEVCRARALQPSYIACGPIHATQLKQMPWRPQGNVNLAYWCRLLAGTPVVAIGGMDAPRARAAMRAGAASVAVVGAITRSPTPEASIARLREAIAEGEQDARRLASDLDMPAFARNTLAADDAVR
jgi:hydroxymethylpyrimidine kinase/phosphomethylpyrimidine kinase/thiamine-phosphate diphosphorylase